MVKNECAGVISFVCFLRPTAKSLYFGSHQRPTMTESSLRPGNICTTLPWFKPATPRALERVPYHCAIRPFPISNKYDLYMKETPYVHHFRPRRKIILGLPSPLHHQHCITVFNEESESMTIPLLWFRFKTDITRTILFSNNKLHVKFDLINNRLRVFDYKFWFILVFPPFFQSPTTLHFRNIIIDSVFPFIFTLIAYLQDRPFLCGLWGRFSSNLALKRTLETFGTFSSFQTPW